MELNGFMIGPEIKKLFKIKVDTPTAGHPVESAYFACAFVVLIGLPLYAISVNKKPL